MNIKKVQGFLDYFNNDIILFNYIIEKFKTIVAKYNFQEMITPIMEYVELFNRTLGSGTDIVEKEMYIFNSSKEKQIALRPENTAGIIRAYIENNLSHNLSGIKKFFYIGPMFRHERPQKGRLRQFYQLGCEVIGSHSPYSDAEIIMLANNFLLSLNLYNIELHINSIGCNTCRKEYLKVLINYYEQQKENICENCKIRLQKNPLRLLDCKEEKCIAIKNNAPKINQHICNDCKSHFENVLKILNNFNIKYLINPFLVRGLDYYTHTTFEFINKNLGAQNAVLAGGRYNDLIEILGGEKEPAIGFAAGLERLLLSSQNLEIKSNQKKIFIATYNYNAHDYALQIAEKIRKINNYSVEINFLDKSLKAQLRTADKLDFDFVIVIGDDEINSKKFKIKNLKTGEEKEIIEIDLENYFSL
ncbi:MAG TPA: histidine--tRNA ligase [bacterium]|nr:histidine--tRNA ligase [bacterium]HOL47388.1 histidine--tRNA ligase [bacterium]HPQ18113.1 histidine--tRNA ligase [bacterium]